ncbi:MAG: universal stress protein [bacterium]
MYETIYVPVDNSPHSNEAIHLGVELGKAFSSRMVGCHVYAARMHDYRFKQMEFTLPEEYLEENELMRQRKIHDSLITMGLKLISDSYLAPMAETCATAGLEFEPRMMDGKHSVELLRDIDAHGYDLVVLGALGLGRVRDSQIGSVCERVVRSTTRDVLVIKDVPAKDGTREATSDTILVGIDGSPQSFGALMTAIELARKLGKRVEAVAVYDPYLHYSVFASVVDVLTEKAAKVFRFEEQNQLHEEIIDTGLAQIYESHLKVAEHMARSVGVEITRTLLDGKAFQKVLDHVRKTRPWLLVLGRIGVHSPSDERSLGSNTENLLRQAPCNVLLTTRVEHPELDVKAEETIRWTPEAEERMTNVPPLVQGIARTAIYRLAVEQGHSVITSSLLDEAMDRYMPKATAEATTKFAEALILERAKEQPVAVCRRCGVTASETEPVKCAVCGATTFDKISAAQVAEIIRMEGGAEAETTYDGRSLTWTQDAKRALWTLKEPYQRRRTKARIEKSVRLKRLDTVTLELARGAIEDELGAPLALGEREPTSAGSAEAAGLTLDDGKKLIARDDKKNPLFSTRKWTADAVQRVFRVPAGFMRTKTQERIEALADERQSVVIDLALVEEAIGASRQLMAEMIQGYAANPEAARRVVTAPSAPALARPGSASEPVPLNEVGIMSALSAMRQGGQGGESADN